MARKRSNDVLAPRSLSLGFGTIPDDESLTWGRRHALTKDEQCLIEGSRKQNLAIEISRAKALHGASRILEIHECAALAFDDTSCFIMELKDRPGRSQWHQAFTDQFYERQMQLLARHMLSLVEVAATDIGMIVHEDPYPPPEPEPRPGFLQRVFGGS
jgi:hypothetical protein